MGYYNNYGNKGYDGYSMSIRARLAYEDGEMPKSKWTKKAMLETIKEYCEDYDVPYNEKVEKWKKDQIFDRYFEYKSWHHTSLTGIDNFVFFNIIILQCKFTTKRGGKASCLASLYL